MKTITIQLTDLEWKAMADVVPDPEAWILTAASSKKTKCIKMVIAKEQTRLMNSDQETMPAGIVTGKHLPLLSTRGLLIEL